MTLTGGAGTLPVGSSRVLKLRTYRDAAETNDGYVASAVTTRVFNIFSKDYADGTPAGLVSQVVTKVVDSTTCYIEDQSRVYGIRVQTSNAPNEGNLVNVSGTLATNSDGERFISSATAESLGTAAHPILPLGMPNRSLGGGDWNYDSESGAGQQGITDGAGLNNIGLLVKTTGCVCSYSTSSFEITDGSPQPITVITPTGVTPPESGYVGVTGVCSRQSDGNGGYEPVLLVRTGDDITNCIAQCSCAGGGRQAGAQSGFMPELPEFDDTDTVARALGQSVGALVTVRTGNVRRSSSDGFVINDGWSGSTVKIYVPGDWAVDEWWTVDVAGVLTTLPDGTRAIEASQVLVYTDSADRPFPIPIWRRNALGQSMPEWPYKQAATRRSM